MATRIIRHESIDLVFLDYNMPGKNGIEVLHEIKVINDVLPVIMLTANSDLDIFQWALEGGAFTLLPKPVDIRQIRASVQNALFGFQF